MEAHDAEAQIEGNFSRIRNSIYNNVSGILGAVVPLIVGNVVIEKDSIVSKLSWVWFTIFWVILTQPISPPVVGQFPVFLFPLLGITPSDDVCKCYFDAYNLLFVVGGWVLLLFNYCGLDRRLMLMIISTNNPSRCSTQRILIKCSFAAFVLSMISQRLIVTSNIMQLVCPVLINIQSAIAANRNEDINYNKFRYILCGAIQSSSIIGSTAIIYTSFTSLAALSMWKRVNRFEDSFNFLQFTMFALPCALVMFVINVLYYVIILRYQSIETMSEFGMKEIHTYLQSQRKLLPNLTIHEKLCIVFWAALTVVLFSRWAPLNGGWMVQFIFQEKPYPGVLDGSILCGFAILFHIIPKDFSSIKVFSAEKLSDLEQLKQETTLLLWKFVDKHTNYAYIFLIGAGSALVKTIKNNNDMQRAIHSKMSFIENSNFYVSSAFIIIVSALLSNLMTSIGALIVLLPAILFLEIKPLPLAIIACGHATAFGFISSFLNTPSYYSRTVGKVPFKYMLQYNLPSVVICCFVLWTMIVTYAEVFF